MSYTKQNRLQFEIKPGDAAIDGLVGGLVGGVVMLAYLVVTSLVAGRNVTAMVRMFAPAGYPWLIGMLLHLAVSAIYGILYGLLFWLFLRRWLANRPVIYTELVGGLYGIVLWLTANSFVLPATNSPLVQLPGADFGLAHAVYGAVVGWWVLRSALGRQGSGI